MFDPESTLKLLFYRLRDDGFNLSIKEYFATLDVLKFATLAEIKAGWATKDKEGLKELIRLVWCKSLEEQSRLDILFDVVIRELLPTTTETHNPNQIDHSTQQKDFYTSSTKNNNIATSDVISSDITFPQQTITVTPKPSTLELSPLPVRPPLEAWEEEDNEFVVYYPISRRFMVYSWQYLRRPVADGVRDVLDIEKTVEQATKQGFFLEPVYRRREQNHAHLIILVDQEGSMTPFHHFSRDLVETAQYESSMERVDVGYFHNLPARYIYRDRFLIDTVPLELFLSQCDSETRVLIVSDAGAARGHLRGERISATAESIAKIQQYTNLIVWLNPVPQERWTGTTAKFISYLLPMFPLNREGLIQAILTLQN